MGQIKQVSVGSDVPVFNEYDPVTANLMMTTRFGKLQESFTYNADGTVKTRKDELNQTTTLTNYKRGIAQNVEYADLSTESAQVNNIGGIDWIRDAYANQTVLNYDAMGRLREIIYPTGDPLTRNPTILSFAPVASAEYGISAGHWRQTVTSGNAQAVTYYDALWRPVLSGAYDSTNESNTRSMVLRRFDSAGRSVYGSYPQRQISSTADILPGVSTTYDALGRATAISADSELGTLTSTNYYETGFKTRNVNAREFTTTTTYQALDDPNGAVIAEAVSDIAPSERLRLTIARDTWLKPLSVTRANEGGTAATATRYYFYDSKQRLCMSDEPETGATVQDYDLANNVAWRATGLVRSGTSSCAAMSVPASSKVTFGYDPRNRLETTTFGDGSPSIGRSYELDGLLKTITSNGSTWTYGYNKQRSLVSESLAFGADTYSLGWRYNANGHMDQLTYPDGKSVDLSPNALGQVTNIKESGSATSFASAISYYPNGAVAGFTYGNGITHNLTQNARGIPQVSSDKNGSIPVLLDTYTYDKNANVTAIADGTSNGMSRSMTYDKIDRLLTVEAPTLFGSAVYTYDALDNIKSTKVGNRVSSHSYGNASNRLESISSTDSAFNFAYGYDARGNITSRGPQAFQFDLANRMSSAVGKANYTYDGLGRRIKALNTSDSSSLVQVYSKAGQLMYTKQAGGAQASKATKYIYLNRHVIAEVSK